MEILINDTNILFDLYKVGLLDKFFKLPFSFHTIEGVLNEIIDSEEYDSISHYVSLGALHVKTFDGAENLQAVIFSQSLIGNLTLVDSTLLYYAIQTPDSRILTGDRQLRNRATEYKVPVSGILFVIEQLCDCGILTNEVGVAKLQELSRINPRLPKKLINEMIARLGGGET